MPTEIWSVRVAETIRHPVTNEIVSENRAIFESECQGFNSKEAKSEAMKVIRKDSPQLKKRFKGLKQQWKASYHPKHIGKFFIRYLQWDDKEEPKNWHTYRIYLHPKEES